MCGVFFCGQNRCYLSRKRKREVEKPCSWENQRKQIWGEVRFGVNVCQLKIHFTKWCNSKPELFNRLVGCFLRRNKGASGGFLMIMTTFMPWVSGQLNLFQHVGSSRESTMKSPKSRWKSVTSCWVLGSSVFQYTVSIYFKWYMHMYSGRYVSVSSNTVG